jgi:hypothetical protein
MDNRIKGTWHSPDNQKSIKIVPSINSYYNVKEYDKKTKHTQELKVGKEGFDQFLDDLVRMKWRQTAR